MRAILGTTALAVLLGLGGAMAMGPQDGGAPQKLAMNSAPALQDARSREDTRLLELRKSEAAAPETIAARAPERTVRRVGPTFFPED